VVGSQDHHPLAGIERLLHDLRIVEHDAGLEIDHRDRVRVHDLGDQFPEIAIEAARHLPAFGVGAVCQAAVEGLIDELAAPADDARARRGRGGERAQDRKWQKRQESKHCNMPRGSGGTTPAILLDSVVRRGDGRRGLVPEEGLEPPTHRLRSDCSTS
jgi:hypothetical protein